MTGATFASLVRKYTGTDSTTLPDADLLLFANVEKDDLAEFITDQVGEDIFELQFTRDLIANQREYSLPTQMMLHMKRCHAKLDGTNSVLLEEFDKNMIRESILTETQIRSVFAGRKPQFDLLDTGLKIYSEDPIIEVSEGLILDTIIYPENIDADDLASNGDLSRPSTTTVTRLPRASHRVWAIRTSIAYKESRPKAIPLNQTEKNIEGYTERMIANLRGRNLDRSYVPPEPVDNGTQY